MSARIRTGYSFRRAAGDLPDVMARLKAIDLSAAPITDSTAFGWVRWSALAAEAGLKPVYGIELAVKLGEGDKGKPIIDHWTFLAKNSVVPLHRIIEQATAQFYYEPLLTISQALSVADLFTVVGHRTDPKLVEPREDRLFGLSPASTKGWISRVQANGGAFIAVGSNRYAFERQKPLYEALAGKSAEVQSYPQHILSDREWRATVPAELADHALGVRDAVLSQCNAALPRGELPIPARTETLRTLCEDRLGWEFFTRSELDATVYTARLDHELSLIAEKGFEDYFHIVADICNFARQRMLVGPARGSSCGSLVCYLLNITTIDPIPFGLLFERFIDTSRDDLPDIDIDFSEQHRDLVFQYVRERYGADRVARLGTVNFYQARSALNEACKALALPPWTTDPILPLADEMGVRAALHADQTGVLRKHPELELAAELEQHPRHAGQHAAGVVITRGAVTDIVAVDRRSNATMCDKLDAEKLNLLKIDCLGLTQLSIFEHALQLAKLPRDHLFKVPLDDVEAFAVLNQKRFAGVFQFNGKAVQNISEAITITSIHDIVAIIALARPGPLNSGAAREWVRRRRGEDEGDKSALDDLLPETFGLIVYQEQVMRIAREVAGLDWATVNNLRRVIARTQGVEELAKFREVFIAGAVQHMQHEQADKLWRNIVTFGGYGFNKSHAVTYGVIAYWCCWLKAHHSAEFAAAMLSYVSEDQQLNMLREMEHEQLPFVAADPKLSTDKWTVTFINGARQLLGPLTNIVGIGPAHCEEILNARRLGHSLSNVIEKALGRCQFKIPNTSPIANRIAEILPDPREKNIISIPTPIKDIQITGAQYQVVTFAVIDKLKIEDENAPEKLAKRNGRRFDPPGTALRMWINDDEDKIWCKVPNWRFTEVAQPMLDRGRAGTAIYAIKGNVPRDFRMIDIIDVKYIGDLEQDEVPAT